MKRLTVILSLLLVAIVAVHAQPSTKKAAGKKPAADSVYLFSYFTGNARPDEAIRFALSADGFRWRALNDNKAVIGSDTISKTGGVRDPHILRGHDGKTFYMVVTDMVSANGWNSNRGMVLLKSTDLVHWTHSAIHFPNRFKGMDSLLRVWAPQTIYDRAAGKYLVYYSLKHGNQPDKIYYSYANADFTDLETEPKQLFFSPTNGACIDGDIVEKDGKFHLFFKTEDVGKGIRLAIADKLTGHYTIVGGYMQQTPDPVEGAGVFKLVNSSDYILMYDVYTKGRYQFTRTSNLQTFRVVDSAVSMDFHPRHGTVISISSAEARRMLAKWGTEAFGRNLVKDALLSVRGPGTREQNVWFDSAANTLVVPVLPGTNKSKLRLSFTSLAGVQLSPVGKANFANGPVRYMVNNPGQPATTITIATRNYHNPALPGLYADPDILYSAKTGRYYIYPTSDGFDNWSGKYFKAFSSPDMVHWKDEGIILDLPGNVRWASHNAWAPCIIEKKVNGQYKYYYYFTAAQKIGVAVADDPLGPFKDMGQPLIDKAPEGINRGQQIDPDVFTDPVSGKSYLYWGNGYLAGAELNDDMVSLQPGTTKVFTPDNTFREGTYVFYRNGRYYFMWSEDDTRSPNYRVRYGFASSPLGPITKPADNLVLARNDAAGIYGTGHNSVIQVPGRDEWYMVYHRFTYPNGIHMGRSAGFNREVCIDKMEFNADGTIKPVVPTHEGIQPVRAVR